MSIDESSDSVFVRVKKIKLKCNCNGEFRNVILLPEHSFSQLKKRLSVDYGFEVFLKYQDGDGDLIILSSQNDFDDLVANVHADDTSINIIVTESSHLPTLPRRDSTKNLSVFPVSNRQFKSFENPSPSSRSNVSTPFDRFPRIESPLSAVGNFSRERDSQHQSRRNVRWKRGEMLGQGAFGVVYLGLNVETGELMAVKQIAIDEVSTKELSSLENEINLLRSFRHPNIVRYIGTEVTPFALSIFLEYVPGGSLKALIDKFGQLEESVAKSYTRQLLIGLEYLHRHGVVHRDLKGANCLVGNDGVIKLADFGSSKQWRSNNTATLTDTGKTNGDMKGTTPSWMAPEIIKNHGGDISWKKADVWSLGCTTLEMTTGKPPWSQFNNNVTTLYHIACTDTLPVYPATASVELITFLNVCLTREPSKRPDITSLLLHPFVTNMGATFWGANGGGGAFGGFMLRPSTVSASSAAEWDSLGSWRTDGRRTIASTAAAHQPPGSADFPKRLLSMEAGMFLSPLGTRAPLSRRQSANGSEGDDFYQELIPDALKSPARNLGPKPFREEQRVNPFGAGEINILTLSVDNMKVGRLSDSADATCSNDDFDSESVVSYQTRNITSTKQIDESQKKDLLARPLEGTISSFGVHSSTAAQQSVVKKARLLRDHTLAKGHDYANKAREKEKNILRRGKNIILKKVKAGADTEKSVAALLLPTAEAEKEVVKKPKKDGRIMPHNLDTVMREERSMQARNIPQLNGKMNIPLVVSMPPQRSKIPLIVVPLGMGSAEDIPEDLELEESKDSVFLPYDTVDDEIDATSVHSKMTSDNGSVDDDDEVFSDDDAGDETFDVGSVLRDGFPFFKEASYITAGVHTAPSNASTSLHSTKRLIRGSYSASGTCSPASLSVYRNTPGGRSMGGSPISSRNSSSRNSSSRNSFHPESPSRFLGGNKNFISGGRKRSDSRISGSVCPTPTEEVSGRWVKEGSRPRSHNISPARSLSSKKKERELSSDFAAAIITSLNSSMRRGMGQSLYQGHAQGPGQGSGLGHVLGGGVGYNRLSTTRGSIPNGQSKSSNSSVCPSNNTVSDIVSKQHAALNRRSSVDPKNYSGRGQIEKNLKELKDQKIQKDQKEYRAYVTGSDTPIDDMLISFCSQSKSMSALHSAQSSVVSSSRARLAREKDRDKREERLKRNSGNYYVTGNHGLSLESLQIEGTRKGEANINMNTNMNLKLINEENDDDNDSRDDIQKDKGKDKEKEEEKDEEKDGDERDREREREVERERNRENDDKLAGYESDLIEDDCSMTSISQSHFDMNTVLPNSRLIGRDFDRDDELPLSARAGSVLEEHTAAVTSLKNPKRSNLLVSSSLDGTIRLWGKREGRSIMMLDSSNFPLDESPKPKDKRRETDTDSLPEHHPVKISTIWTQALCETFWAACSDGAVRVWDQGGQPMRLLKGHEDFVSAIEGLDTFGGSSQSCLVATGSADRSVRVWDMRSKKAQAFLFRGHTDTILAVRWGVDEEGREDGGRTLVSTSKDKTIRIWDMRAGRLRATLEKHFGSVSSLRFLPMQGKGPNRDKGAIFVTGGRDSMLNIWNASGDCIGSQPGHRGAVNYLSEINTTLKLRFTSMKGSACGLPLMLSAGADNIVKVWDMKRFKCLSEVQIGASTGPLTKVAWVGRSIVTASGGHVRLWDYNKNDIPESSEMKISTCFDGRGVPLRPDGTPVSCEWRSRCLGSHAQICTDLISTDHFVASSSKSGQIFRWERE